MLIEIDTAGPRPIYRQIADRIRLAAARGDLEPGDSLPAVRELARRLVVNPNTVFKAYRELREEGIVETRHGSGTYVASRAQSVARERRDEFLRGAIDRLLTEAGHTGTPLDDLIEMLRRRSDSFELPSKGEPGEDG